MGISASKAFAPADARFVCQACGTMGFPKSITPGNVGTEVLLWIFGILPGILYSVWRVANRKRGCPACGGHMIPSGSPVGLAMLAGQFPRTKSF